jgi:hypothetical protein
VKPGPLYIPSCFAANDGLKFFGLKSSPVVATERISGPYWPLGRFPGWTGVEVAMINFLGCSAQGIAVANGATTLALLEHLVERQILTCRDARAILTNGIDCLEPRSNVRTVAEAIHLMRDQMLPLFPEGGASRQAR